MANAVKKDKKPGRLWHVCLRGPLQDLKKIFSSLEKLVFGAVAYTEFDPDEIEFNMKAFFHTKKQFTEGSFKLLCNKYFVFSVRAYRFTIEEEFFFKMERVKLQASSEAEIFQFGIFLTRKARQSFNVSNVWTKRKLEQFATCSKTLVDLGGENLDSLLEVEPKAGCACQEVETEDVGIIVEVEKNNAILPDIAETEDIDLIVDRAAELLVARSESDPLTFEVKGLVFFFW